jgi:hypothetical protein
MKLPPTIGPVRMHHPPDNNSGPSPEIRAEIMTNLPHLKLNCLTMHYIVPCPQLSAYLNL